MSLSERLKAAEAARRAAQPDPPTEESESAGDAPPQGLAPVLDLRTPTEPAVDLRGPGHLHLVEDVGTPADASLSEATAEPRAGIAYDPIRVGDASMKFGDEYAEPDRRSDEPCPRCGGPTQVDLYDQVHQVVSLSCTSCFHMFRHHI